MNYRQVHTDVLFTTVNNVDIQPLATLEDGYGGVEQWAIDDHCYILYLKQEDGKYKPTYHIFKEAFEVLKKLLNPIGYGFNPMGDGSPE